MKDAKEMLKHRKMLKIKKPSFIRQNTLKKRLDIKWRKPKGLHSKMRRSLKGHKRIVREGYKSPVLVKSLDRTGLKIVFVGNIKELGRVDKDTESVVIRKTVGLRKKIELLKKAKELSLIISNIKNIPFFLAEAEKRLKERKENKEKKLKQQKEKEKEKEKKGEKKEKGKEAEKKKEESDTELAERIEKEESEQKKEKDKVLTKKQ
ncbi:50S ribosomal protein L32e [Candidatus Woesearchaeota archaeon]|nr:50S ribosomal protein L32e [Candidatus Woesearchaeota archaeon]|tara:strand:+ start:11018 stop:11635 length:618 start_codon:yes stop_codon:yes gene_type:complete